MNSSALTVSAGALLASCLLASCGGGDSGGGGGGSVAPPPPVIGPTIPLAVTSDKAVEAARLSVALFEGPLRLVQLARNTMPDRRDAGAPLTYTLACRTRGEVDVDFTDGDATRTPTPGDFFRLTFRDCDAVSAGSSVRGEMRVAIGAAPTGLAEGETGLAFEITSSAGLRITRPEQPALEFSGTFQALWTNSPEAIVWQARTASTGEIAALTIDTSTGRQTRETLVGVDLRRRIDYDLAEVALQLSGTLRSESLQGQLIARTPEPLRGMLNTYPNAGRLEFEGASAARITVAANLELNSDSANVSADVNGDGNAELRDRLTPWSQFNDGLLWAEPRYDLNRLLIETFSAQRPTQLIGRATPSLIAVNGIVDLQFTRLIGSVAEFNPTFVCDKEPSSTPALPDVHGARVLFRPASQLTHGANCVLSPGGTLRDERGNAVGFGPPGNSATRVATRNNLGAELAGTPQVAFAGRSFTLTSTGSFSTDGPITSYRWRQLSGATATIATPMGASTAITLATPTVPAGERPRFELEVRNAAGEYARATTQLDGLAALDDATTLAVVRLRRVRPQAGPAVLYTISSASGPFSTTGNPGLPAGSPGNSTPRDIGPYAGIYRTASGEPADGRIDVRLLFRGQNTLLGLVPGTYSPAGAVIDDANPGVLVEFPALTAGGCRIVSFARVGSITILEAQQDAGGAPLRLAVDFSYRCGDVINDEFEATGALRYRSAIPLPPGLLP